MHILNNKLEKSKSALFSVFIAVSLLLVLAVVASAQPPDDQSAPVRSEEIVLPEEDVEEKIAPPRRVRYEVIDEFEYTNPKLIWRTRAEHDSSVDITPSPRARIGSLALEVDYRLSGPAGVPSQVYISRTPEQTNWSLYQEFSLWVKGDGQGNILRIRFCDADGIWWVYDNKDVLSRTGWEIIKPQMGEFIPAGLGKRPVAPNLTDVREISFGIFGRTDIETAGTVFFDSFRGGGTEVTPVRIKREVERIAFGLTTVTNFRQTPEVADEIWQEANLKVLGQQEKFALQMEIAARFGEFGQSSAITETGDFTQNYLDVEIPNLKLSANKLGWIDTLEVGNIWIDYNKYTFGSQWWEWGHRGARLELGSELRLPVRADAFVLKSGGATYTTGARLTWSPSIWQHRLSFVGTYPRAEVPSAVEESSLTEDTLERKYRLLAKDNVFTYELTGTFIPERLVFRGIWGGNWYKADYSADYSDAFSPRYLGQREPKLSELGGLCKVEIDMNSLVWKGFDLHTEYRDVGPEYLPYWRYDRKYFGADYADQGAYYITGSQKIGILNFSSGYEFVQRKSSSSYRVNSVRWGLGFGPIANVYGWFSQDFRDDHTFYDDARYGLDIERNYNVTISEFGLNYDFSSELRATIRLSGWHGYDRGWEERIDNDSLNLKLEYYPSENTEASLEYIKTIYNHWWDEPYGEPYNDNRLWFKFRLEL